MKNNALNEKLPLFVVAGMPRGGTTFLYHYLSQHPDIFLPYRKEVNYFSVNHKKGLTWYHGLYDELKENEIAGDISPPCFLTPDSMGRIKAYSPEVKVILIVRDPAEWAVSFYHQFKSFNKDIPELEQFLLKGYRYNLGDEYIDIQYTGNWIGERIKEYQQAFGDNLLVYEFSHFKKNPLDTLKVIETLLGVDDFFTTENFDNRRINESARRNNRLLSYILSRQSVIDSVGKIVPRSLIMKVRYLFDKFSVKHQGETSKQSSHSEDELAIAKQILAEQRANVASVFRDAPILIGDKAYILDKKTHV
jgi:hypothetical protein